MKDKEITNFTGLTQREKALLKLSFENVLNPFGKFDLEFTNLSKQDKKAIQTIDEEVLQKVIEDVINRDCKTISKQRDRERKMQLQMLTKSLEMI